MTEEGEIVEHAVHIKVNKKFLKIMLEIKVILVLPL